MEDDLGPVGVAHVPGLVGFLSVELVPTSQRNALRRCSSVSAPSPLTVSRWIEDRGHRYAVHYLSQLGPRRSAPRSLLSGCRASPGQCAPAGRRFEVSVRTVEPGHGLTPGEAVAMALALSQIPPARITSRDRTGKG